MNKVIRELFVKAGGTIEVCDVTQDEVLTYSEECDPEVFAKLVIEECVGIANSYDNFGWCSVKIKEHFGVK